MLEGHSQIIAPAVLFCFRNEEVREDNLSQVHDSHLKDNSK